MSDRLISKARFQIASDRLQRESSIPTKRSPANRCRVNSGSIVSRRPEAARDKAHQGMNSRDSSRRHCLTCSGSCQTPFTCQHS
jgi:hypothetical protein